MKYIEIERKFLVNSEVFKKDAISETRITQGFLNTHPERTVRIRMQGKNGFLTVKGKGNSAGTTRFEWEKEILQEEAIKLIELCEPGILEKTRFEIPLDEHIFEVDVFSGDNEGLIIAEIELRNENEAFTKPDWIGKEVTGQTKYYNSQLSKNPFKNWKKSNDM